jgi:hypothetical protein
VRRGSKGGDGGLATGVQEGEGKLVRELRRGDVVLMVLWARKKKGWNFSSTRNRTAAESEIRRWGVLGCACTEGGRRVDQEEAMRCGSAGGARNWRGGVAEAADGCGQWSSGEVVKRGEEQECDAQEGTEERRSLLGMSPS